MLDRKTFYAEARRRLFGGTLTQGQVDGMNAILDEWERRSLGDPRYLAYMLATAYHEVDKTMQPIVEYGGERYFHRMYDITGERPQVARQLGNLQAGDGALFHGRGLVQLTGRDNYRKMTGLLGERFGADLEADPDKVLEPAIAVAIMFEGMLRGTFTGLSLSAYFNGVTDKPIQARRIINGLDKAELVAGYHYQFLAAIDAAITAARSAA